MTELFKPHGASVITTEGNILRLDVEGPWNDEFFIGFHREMTEAVKQIDLNNYATLLLPRGEALGVQEGIDRHIAFVKKSNTKALAICLINSAIPDITRHMCQRIYTEVGVKFDFFEDEASARAWLLDILAKDKK